MGVINTCSVSDREHAYTMSLELKPCPFCGAAAEYVECHVGMFEKMGFRRCSWVISCVAVANHSMPFPFNTRQDAAAAWNQRPTTTAWNQRPTTNGAPQ